MNAQSKHFQSLAVTILAIATAVTGFGLFGADFQAGEILSGTGLPSFLARAKLLCGALSLICHAILIGTVWKILVQDGDTTRRQVANGPLLWMALQMAAVSLVFILGVLEEPTSE